MNHTENRLSDALHDLVSTQPFEPDRAAIERRGRQARRRARMAGGGIGVGVTAVAVAAAVTASGLGGAGGTASHQASGATAPTTPTTRTVTQGPPTSPLVRLSDTLLADHSQPAGDATLIVRTTRNAGLTVTGADLYTDSGRYYFAQTPAGLPAQVAAHNDRSEGVFARDIAAAVSADSGNLATARQRMKDAALLPGSTTPTTNRAQGIADQMQHVDVTDNWIWNNCMDALVAGSGQPKVRAGVLRILSTMPEVSVTPTTTGGQPTLTLEAGSPAIVGGTNETLVVTANDGIPVSYAASGVNPTSIDYQVSRVSLADVAAGRV